jgi:hypothetical protein
MPKQKVSSLRSRPKKPTTVEFKTKSGETVSIKALQTVKKKERSLPRETKMKRIYLNSNILIAHFSTDKAEEAKKKLVANALAVFAQLKDVQPCVSMRGITEVVNILVSSRRKWIVEKLPSSKTSS